MRISYTKLSTLFFISLFTFLWGCLKREDAIEECPGSCTTITGRLTTLDGKQPIQSTPLIVYWHKRQYLAGGTIRKKARTLTSANGFFELKFLITDEELQEGLFLIEVEVEPSNYLVYDKIIFASKLKRDTTVYLPDFLIPRKAYLEVRLANPEAIQPSDYFASSFGNRMNTQTNNGSWGGTVVTWSSGLPENPITVAGGQPVIIKSIRIKSNVKTTTYDTLNIEVGQKQVYTAQF